MLFVSSLLNVANSAVWIAVPTVQKLLVQEYEVDQHAIVQLTNIAYLLYVPGSILGFFILEKGGVAISTGVGGALLTICCWLRVTSSYIGVFWLEVLASVTFAIGQPLVMNGVSQFNMNWMQEDERFLSTMIYNTVPSSLGGALLGAFVGSGIQSVDDIPMYFVIVGSFVTFATLLYALTIKEKAPFTPDRKKSRAASLMKQHHLQPKQLTIWWTLKQRSFLILMYNVSVQIGLICTFSAILPLYMGALGYSFQETAALLSMFLFSGISGVVILAPATDMLQNHFDNAPKHLLILLAAIGVAGAFSLIANSMENNFSAISISVCLISISITSGIPLALEEGASINPQKAGFSASVMISAGNLLGYGAVYLTEFLKENNNYNKACYAFLGLLSLQFIANLFIESKRAPGDDDDSDYYGDEEYDSNRDDNSNFAEKLYNM